MRDEMDKEQAKARKKDKVPPMLLKFVARFCSELNNLLGPKDKKHRVKFKALSGVAEYLPGTTSTAYATPWRACRTAVSR